jgi:hypothetical protein
MISTNTNSTHISNEPLTTTIAEQYAPGLLRNSIDERIVKIRPMSTPIDQISRCAGSRAIGSMTVEYYSVDTKQTETTVRRKIAESTIEVTDNSAPTLAIDVTDAAIFDISETVLMPDLKGYDSDGNECGNLVLYVYSKDERYVTFVPINAQKNSEGSLVIPTLEAGMRIVRMGRAATELDVQSPQFAVLPRKASNNCQIFKMQVEQSTMQKIADKEIGWTFNDQEEAAIIDMRLGMEKNFLFGSRCKIYDYNKNESVYLTGGIWNQASREFKLTLSDTLTTKHLTELCSAAFTGTGGSKRKILLAGTEMMEALSNALYTKIVSAGETFVKWGIKFKEIQSNFGTLYVLHSEVFDQCGHAKDGFILDPEYLTKYCHIPFNVETLDLRRSGVRNTDAVVITEASCLVLRFPDAHLRLIGVE